ncbi:MAG: LamG domain-containing protein [Candidatus Paceibacterota bacterium]|jgi:prepilin-type N-terminal cleavage/methylation domain-containing protein|nr:LamG domain-containing protein [Candidatus Paceibacterota bacterium]MDD5555513.1 LamG domain-containing protein [Candidatus Paceibacterota bacterium]
MSKSFTLIEILVVIVIIGIISAFIIVSMAGVSSKAAIAKSQVFSNSLRNSLLLNLISEWKLDGSGNDSWGANNGTLVGPTHLPVAKSGSDCVSGGCYQFDGTEDYISIGDKDNLSFANNIFTISGWFKLNTNNNFGILGKRGGPWEYSIHTRIADVIYFYCWNSAGSSVYSSSFSITTGVWVYFTWTADGSKNYIYKNSIYLGANNKSSNDMSNTTASFEIGRSGDGAGLQYTNGLIDDIHIYNQTVPTSQVQQNYYSGLSKLLVQGGFDMVEYQQRIGELKFGLSNNE